MNKIESFLETSYPLGSYHAILQKFIKKQYRKGLSEPSIKHLYRSLYALGETLGTVPIKEITYQTLKKYVDDLKLSYAPGTIRPVVGDIKQFFKWCKKKKYHPKNVGKRLTKPRKRPSQLKAAPEEDVKGVMAYLAKSLNGYVYRDLFGHLQADPEAAWTYETYKQLHDLFVLTFLYETGCRAGELANLSARAMNKTTLDLKPAYTVISWGKTNDCDLHFTNATAELWRLWYQLRPHDSPLAAYSWRRGQTPTKFLTNGISQMLVRRCRQAGKRPFRTHALRHAKVKRSRQLVGIEVTSVLIDHRRLDTTYGYANIDANELKDATIKTGLNYDLWVST